MHKDEEEEEHLLAVENDSIKKINTMVKKNTQSLIPNSNPASPDNKNNYKT